MVIILISLAVIAAALIGIICVFIFFSGGWGGKDDPEAEPTATAVVTETPSASPTDAPPTDAPAGVVETPVPMPTPAPAAPNTGNASGGTAPGSGNTSGGNSGVVEYPSYSTYRDSEFKFSCAYPNHFQVYNEDDNFMRYTLEAPDDTAILKICATYNSNGCSVKTVSDNFKLTYPGSVDYEDSGDDWCAVRTYQSGTYHYCYFKVNNGMIRGFEFHFSAGCFDTYDRYINTIYQSLSFE